MMEAFEEPYFGINFKILDDDYYEAEDKQSWGVNPVYTHDWHVAPDTEIKVQFSRREMPALELEDQVQCKQAYFRHLEFEPARISCLSLPEIIAEKIRACYQRRKARDAYDLWMVSRHPRNEQLIRGLTVLKFWQTRTIFDPGNIVSMFDDDADFKWDDLRQLVRHDAEINPHQILSDCRIRYDFLKNLTKTERELANDKYLRCNALAEGIQRSLPNSSRIWRPRFR